MFFGIKKMFIFKQMYSKVKKLVLGFKINKREYILVITFILVRAFHFKQKREKFIK